MSGTGVSREEFLTLKLEVSELRRELAEARTALALLRAERQPVLPIAAQSAAASSEFEFVAPEVQEKTYHCKEVASDLPADRAEASRSIGLWIVRCLEDQPRGLSGRERIRQASKLYIVVRSFDLTIYNPPRVFSSWQEARRLTHRGGQPGDSIFVGLPSKAEVKLALATAGLEVPSDLAWY